MSPKDWVAINFVEHRVFGAHAHLTTAHIAKRLTREAKLLLHHTDWSVGDIADRLSFEYATYFHRFFKQHTGTTSLAFR